jgi:hypothetical protein
MDVRLLCLLRVMQVARPLPQADLSFRGALSGMCVCVWFRNVKKKWSNLGPTWGVGHRKKKVADKQNLYMPQYNKVKLFELIIFSSSDRFRGW